MFASFVELSCEAQHTECMLGLLGLSTFDLGCYHVQGSGMTRNFAGCRLGKINACKMLLVTGPSRQSNLSIKAARKSILLTLSAGSKKQTQVCHVTLPLNQNTPHQLPVCLLAVTEGEAWATSVVALDSDRPMVNA